MNNPIPNAYQKEQALQFKKYKKTIGVNGVDYVLLEKPYAFEWWDNIGTEEYTKQGGLLDERLEPEDNKLFEDCLLWAKDYIEEIINANSKS